ncbi:MAG: hypothetical protein AAFU54_21420 [Chloroflexota bacterium]
MTIPDDTHAFLTALYRRSGGYLTLSAIHPNRTQPTPSRHIPLADTPALESGLFNLLAANRGDWGAVFSVATRRTDLGRWHRGGSADLYQLPALFADIDRPPCEVLPQLRDTHPPPSAVVLSGGGVHAYWWLSEPTDNWQWASAALTTLAEQLDGDHTNLAGAMRLVGSRNTKPGRDNARCSLHTLNDHHYRKEDFIIPIPKPIETVAVRDPPRRRGRSPTVHNNRTLNPQLIQAVSSRLLAHGGHIQRNGWIAATCPCGHRHDRPGAHFAFNPQIGVGVCHGRHGRLLLRELCHHLNIDPIHYGGLYA